MLRRLTWNEVAVVAQQRLNDAIPEEWRLANDQLPCDDQVDVTGIPATSGILSELELEITECFAVDILRKLAAGEWTSQEVTIAFCKRAAIAHQLTNCLTTVMFRDAIKRAKELDEYFATTGTIVGPLHGLPISLKDCFDVHGYPTSVGFTSWALDPVLTESTIVTILRKAGAVLYVKTNVPTAMMFSETANNCYGRTLNPCNRTLTPGGSSGGEAALIAMRGSCLGVGTDIGGSLRIPAACVGLYAIRPSCGRSPHSDARTALAGQEAVGGVNGPMARSIDDLELWMRAVIASEPWLKDPKSMEIPYRTPTLPLKLKIAVLWDNGMVAPTPPVARALKSVTERLKTKGYAVIDWSSDGHAEAAMLCKKFFLADGGKSVGKVLQKTGEPWRPELSDYEQASEMGVYALWQLQKERTALQAAYLKRMVEAGVDAILGPTTAYVAPKNGELKTVSYTNVFSVLDYPSVSFPTGLSVDKAIDKNLSAHTPLSELDRLTQENYNAMDVHGFPISLQLTAKRLQEELLLAVVSRIQTDLII